jgi:hypothetical protein
MSLRSRPAALSVLVVVLVASYVVAVVATSGPAAADGTVTVTIQGRGTVTGPGISCSEAGGPGPDCSEFYADTSECDPANHPPCTDIPPSVELVAAPDRNGYAFVSFSGCTSTSQRTCTVLVNASKNVTALFADAVDPVTTLNSPAQGAVVSSTVNASATATDNLGVANVAFFVNGVLKVTDTSAPYQATIDVSSLNSPNVTVGARATDVSGRQSAMSSRTIMVDNTAPTVGVTGPDGQVFGPGATETWTLTPADTLSGVASVACSVVPTGQPATFAPCSGGTSSHTVSQTAGGSYTFHVRVMDQVANVVEATRAFTVDATPPDTAVTSGPADGAVLASGSVTYGVSANEAGSTVGCRLFKSGTMAPAFAPCTTASSFTASGLDEGLYTFQARGTDGVGNVDPSPATRTFTVDTVPPDTSVLSGPGNGSLVNTRTVAFGLGGTEPGSTMACRLYRSGTTPPAFAPCTTSTSFTASGLDDGSYVFEARATDVAGNTDASPVARTFAVDATPPTVSITKQPKRTVKTPKKKVKVAFGFAANDLGASFRCSLDGAAFADCPAAVSFKVKVGKHTLSVVAVDAAGNVSPTLAILWKVKRVKKHH